MKLSRKTQFFLIILSLIPIFQVFNINSEDKDTTIRLNYTDINSLNISLNRTATLNGDEAEYLIITYDDFSDEILPLAQSKVNKGLDTKIVSLSDIDDDSALGIFNYIRNCYQSWDDLEYILLVGDVEYIPTHYVNEHPYYSNVYTATDLYYGTMDSNIIGEDIFQEIFVGRLPAKSSSDVEIMVNKILHYESTYDPSLSWTNDILCAAHDEAGRFFDETSDEIADYLDPIGYDITKVYSGGDYTGTTKDVIDAINQDVFFINHRNHGSRAGWANPSFIINDIDDLEINDHYPTMFSINCESGWFDYSSNDCFGEALLKEENKGVVGFIGASRVSYSGYNDMLDKGFIDSIWPNFIPDYENNYGSAANLGKIIAYGKQYLYDEYYLPGGCEPYDYGTPSYSGTVRTFELFNLLGDPEFSFIDVQSPSWIQVPTDQNIKSEEFSYDLDACDNFYIDRWTIDNSHFTIDKNGIITNNNPLETGDYIIEVRAYDSSNNYCSATFTVSVNISGESSGNDGGSNSDNGNGDDGPLLLINNLPILIIGVSSIAGALLIIPHEVKKSKKRNNYEKPDKYKINKKHSSPIEYDFKQVQDNGNYSRYNDRKISSLNQPLHPPLPPKPLEVQNMIHNPPSQTNLQPPRQFINSPQQNTLQIPPQTNNSISHTKQIIPPFSENYVNKRKCPRCGAIGFAIKEMDDKSKIISYIPKTMYAKKRICTKCMLEF